MKQLRRRTRKTVDKRRASFLSPEKSLLRRTLMTEQLEARTVMAADGIYSDFWNGARPLDVNNDGRVSSIDALVIINELNTGGARQLPMATTASMAAEGEAPAGKMYYDVNNDGYVSSVDALSVINSLNGEAEDVPTARFTIEAVNVGTNTPVSTIAKGSDFDLRVTVRDIRPLADREGVFGAYLDILHNDALVDVYVYEVQHLELADAAEQGNFTLSFSHGGQTFTTAPILFDPGSEDEGHDPISLATTIQQRLEALPNIGAGNVRVAYDRIIGDEDKGVDEVPWRWLIRFENQLGDTDVPLITFNNIDVKDAANNLVTGQVLSTANGVQSDPNAIRYAFLSPNVFDPAASFVYNSAVSAGLETGRFDDVGAQAKSFVGPFGTTVELVRVRLKAVDGGNLSFTGDVINVQRPEHDTTVYGSNIAVDPSLITVVNTSITITEPVTAVVDSANVNEDGNVLIDVLDNDTVLNGAKALNGVGTASNGQVQIENGQIRYTPATNFFGTDSFTYTVTDGLGNFDTATVTVTVASINDAPTLALPSAQTVNEDATLSLAGGAAIQIADVDAAASDVTVTLGVNNGTISLFTIAGLTSVSGNGTANITATGPMTALNAALNGLTYTPTANFAGSSTITVQANDGGANGAGGALIANGNIAVTVAAVNDAPTIATPVGPHDAVEELEYVFGSAAGADAPAITIDDIDAPASANLEVTLTVANGTLTLGSESNVVVDVQNGGRTLVVTGTKANLNTALNGLTYVSDMEYEGPETLTVKVNDLGATGSPGAQETTANIGIDVAPGEFPRARRDMFDATEDTTLIIEVADLLANDSPHDGSNLLFAGLASSPLNGSAVVMDLNETPADPNDDIIVYTPDGNYFGPDSFTYRITDDAEVVGEEFAFGTVILTVANVQDLPEGVTDNYATNEDTPLVVSTPAEGVLDNDVDPDQPLQTLTASLVSQPANGSVVLNANGTFTFTPAANFSGTTSFTYKVSDGVAETAAVTVNITVNAVNDAPTANSDNFSTAEDTPLSIPLPGLLGNDTDIENSALNAVIVSQPAHGSVTLNANGSFTYTPHANYNGPDSFTYKANDGELDSAPATVSLTVTPVNDPPVSADDSYTVAEDAVLNVNAANGVLKNDTDIDSATIGAIVVQQPTNGTLTLNTSTGAFVYTPNPNFFGTDTFTYRASDAFSNSATATVTITVTPVNDAPVATNNSYTTAEDSPLTIAGPGVLGNDSDIDPGTTLTAAIVGQPAHGTVTLNADGSFTYTPAANYFGPDSFTYRASDGALTSNVATVNLTVTPVNDNPNAVPDGSLAAPITMIKNFNNQLIQVLANDNSGPDPGETLTVVGTSGTTAQGGTVTVGTNGTVVYNAPTDYEGIDTFTYTISDGNGGTATATVTVDVVNFIPTDISGYVYIDTSSAAQPNGNGVKESGERGLAMIAVTLSSPTGKDMFGVTFNPITVETDASGKFVFPAIRPGTYVITQTQPEHLRDGSEAAGGAFASVTANDKITVTLPQLGLAGGAHNNNFAELGIDAGTLTDSRGLMLEMLSSSSSNGIILGSYANGESFWYWALNGWGGMTDVKVTLSSNLATATLSATVNGTLYTKTIGQAPNGSGARFRILGTNAEGGHIIRLDGTATDFLGLTANQAAGEGEGLADEAYNHSVDAVMNEASWA